MILTQTSLMAHILKSTASHQTSLDRRNLYVEGILAMERLVPLFQVSTSFLHAKGYEIIHKCQHEHNSDPPLGLSGYLHVSQVHEWRGSIYLEVVSLWLEDVLQDDSYQISYDI